MSSTYVPPLGVPLEGFVTKIELTRSGYQITSIDGVAYATLWDATRMPVRVGSRVRFVVDDSVRQGSRKYDLYFADVQKVVAAGPKPSGSLRSLAAGEVPTFMSHRVQQVKDELDESLRHGGLYRHPERYRSLLRDAGVRRLPRREFKTARGEQSWDELAHRLIEWVQRRASHEQLIRYGLDLR